MAGQLIYTQERAESLLAANPYFEDVTVVTIQKGVIQNMIDAELAKLGVGVLIQFPSLKLAVRDDTGPFWEISLTLEVVEFPILNTTGKTGPDVCENLVATLHNSPQEGDNVFNHQASMMTGIGKNDKNATLITYANDFVTYGGVNLTGITRAATPSISDSGGTITLTSSTPGASIFYTVNGKTPNPVNGTLYTIPFSILSGVTVKARAWIWGYTVSQQSNYTRA